MDTETGPGTVTMEAHRPPHPRMPYAEADHTLRALAAAAMGFSRHAIGGLHGATYHVTSLQGPPPVTHSGIFSSVSVVEFLCAASCNLQCHFARHDKTMLIGADPTHVDDKCISVTIHHCFFDGTRLRHPRLHFGKCNIYEGGHKKTVFKYMSEKAVDKEETVAVWIRSEGKPFLHGALSCLVEGPGGECIFRREKYYDRWTMEVASSALK
ncbi:hypothetical protein ZWY2020_059241 [Hordeum vulgare]|nr:hypothetical protein ZWY2020_059241 [Hordeum vulgare]